MSMRRVQVHKSDTGLSVIVDKKDIAAFAWSADPKVTDEMMEAFVYTFADQLRTAFGEIPVSQGETDMAALTVGSRFTFRCCSDGSTWSTSTFRPECVFHGPECSHVWLMVDPDKVAAHFGKDTEP